MRLKIKFVLHPKMPSDRNHKLVIVITLIIAILIISSGIGLLVFYKMQQNRLDQENNTRPIDVKPTGYDSNLRLTPTESTPSITTRPAEQTGDLTLDELENLVDKAILKWDGLNSVMIIENANDGDEASWVKQTKIDLANQKSQTKYIKYTSVYDNRLETLPSRITDEYYLDHKTYSIYTDPKDNKVIDSEFYQLPFESIKDSLTRSLDDSDPYNPELKYDVDIQKEEMKFSNEPATKYTLTFKRQIPIVGISDWLITPVRAEVGKLDEYQVVITIDDKGWVRELDIPAGYGRNKYTFKEYNEQYTIELPEGIEFKEQT